MFDWLRRLWSARPAPGRAPRHVRARYDAAQTTDENTRHWSAADGLSAVSANDLSTRKVLRERARYEYANNSYCRGLVNSLANDLVGTGPRLALEGTGAARAIERAWGQWADAVDLPGKLRVMAQAKRVDGEPFALLTNNPALPSPVQLDLRLVECDQFSGPWDWATRAGGTDGDGITYDAAGNPVSYTMLTSHPGGMLYYAGDYQQIPARLVIHWFRKDRPGQLRGVPEITPALPLFAQLRRFTLATLSAAELAANFSAVVESEMPPDGEATAPTPFETLEVERGMLLTLPAGGKVSQFKAEHPTTTYEMFKREILKEIGRAVSSPYNITATDSSPYNYSSARMDALLYRGMLRVERKDCERWVLNRIFAAWLEEAVMVPGLLPAGVTPANVAPAWYWPGWEYMDPQKEAAADTERLANGTTTLSELYSEWGQDWETMLRQRGREIALCQELGIPLPQKASTPAAAAPATPAAGEAEDSADEEEEDAAERETSQGAGT